MSFLRRRPDVLLMLAGLLVLASGAVLYASAPAHDFGLVVNAPFSILDLLSAQQKAGLVLLGIGALVLAAAAGTTLGLRLGRRKQAD